MLVDHGDNQSAGAQTDIMDVLEEALKQGLKDACAGPFCDPDAVRQMIASGPGAQITLDLGGKTDIPKLGLVGRPLRLSGTVSHIREADHPGPDGQASGFFTALGPAAVLDVGTLQILVSSRPYEPVDAGCFLYAGIEPLQKNFILIKSRQNFRPGFEAIAGEIIMVAGPGVGNSDFNCLPYKHIPRPIYPVDPDARMLVRGN